MSTVQGVNASNNHLSMACHLNEAENRGVAPLDVENQLKKNLRNTMPIFLSWSRFDYLLLTVIILVKARTPSF
jgi:hypothetical protein